jgi:hypothetical protein
MRELSFCPTGERQLAAYLENRLNPRDRAAFGEHASTCPVCQTELDLWDKLNNLPSPAPGAYFRQDFDAMLAREARMQPAKPTPQWFARPQLAWAAAAAFAIGGFFAGNWFSTERRQPEVSELRQELHNVRGMVAMSLLQQQSAVDRLRGVNYSVRLDNPDEEVVSALIQTLRSDSSVDVRLAATDALRKYSVRPQVRQSMAEALLLQDSPLVQLALIDTMVDLRERRAASTFNQLAARESIDPTVKSRLEKALEELKVQ